MSTARRQLKGCPDYYGDGRYSTCHRAHEQRKVPRQKTETAAGEELL